MIDVITTLIVLIALTITRIQRHYAIKYYCLSNVFLKASSIKLPYGNF